MLFDDSQSGTTKGQTGLLKCSCGLIYPIIDGVPRFMNDSDNARPETVENMGHPAALVPSRKHDDYEDIRASFTKEWAIFDYDTDKTWGWTLEQRKQIFLDDMALTADQVVGKTLLDAGCGNGTLTAALGTLGMDVIGIDLNDMLGTANQHKTRAAGKCAEHVHFVQGNLVNPPLQRHRFDLVYCSGVIHHTPNPHETFRRLVGLVKPGGRLYVWVYGRRNPVVRLFMDSGRQLRRFMSLESLMTLCHITAPIYKIGTELLNAAGVMEFRSRTTREITLDLFDAFAPQYNYHYAEQNLETWFIQEGLRNVAVSGRQKHGFGAHGDKP